MDTRHFFTRANNHEEQRASATGRDAELKWDPSIDATQIGVEVKDGIVTLAGHVGSYAEKWEAERAAQRVSGVRAMAIEMDVTLSGSSQRNDADIARSAENVLECATYLPKDRVGVMKASPSAVKSDIESALQRRAAVDAQDIVVEVLGSEVTLSGTARNWSARELACNSAWGTPGVHSVIDNISVIY